MLATGVLFFDDVITFITPDKKNISCGAIEYFFRGAPGFRGSKIPEWKTHRGSTQLRNLNPQKKPVGPFPQVARLRGSKEDTQIDRLNIS